MDYTLAWLYTSPHSLIPLKSEREHGHGARIAHARSFAAAQPQSAHSQTDIAGMSRGFRPHPHSAFSVPAEQEAKEAPAVTLRSRVARSTSSPSSTTAIPAAPAAAGHAHAQRAASVPDGGANANAARPLRMSREESAALAFKQHASTFTPAPSPASFLLLPTELGISEGEYKQRFMNARMPAFKKITRSRG